MYYIDQVNGNSKRSDLELNRLMFRQLMFPERDILSKINLSVQE